MDQLICASLSQTHYWYEVGMLKVPMYGLLLLVVQTQRLDEVELLFSRITLRYKSSTAAVVVYAGTFNMPIHTNSGCGKERRILLVHGDLPRQHSFGTTLRITGPVPADSRQ